MLQLKTLLFLLIPIIYSCSPPSEKNGNIIISPKLITDTKHEEGHVEYYNRRVREIGNNAFKSEITLLSMAGGRLHSCKTYRLLSSAKQNENGVIEIWCGTPSVAIFEKSNSPYYDGISFNFEIDKGKYSYSFKEWSDVCHTDKSQYYYEYYPLWINKDRFKPGDTLYAKALISETEKTERGAEINTYIHAEIKAIVR
jgi:hypothetical protein